MSQITATARTRYRALSHARHALPRLGRQSMRGHGLGNLGYGHCAFPLHRNYHYSLEGVLEVCDYHRVPWVKFEPKYTLSDFVETAKAMENWVGIEICSRILR